NDLSRVRIGGSVDTVTNANYLNLSGSNIVVNVNDSGVDATHSELANRVFGDFPTSLIDSNGHGTHVAGIIASSGSASINPKNLGAVASGSVSNASFRGIAPAARIFSISSQAFGFRLNGMEASFGSSDLDTYLQETPP